MLADAAAFDEEGFAAVDDGFVSFEEVFFSGGEAFVAFGFLIVRVAVAEAAFDALSFDIVVSNTLLLAFCKLVCISKSCSR